MTRPADTPHAATQAGPQGVAGASALSHTGQEPRGAGGALEARIGEGAMSDDEAFVRARWPGAWLHSGVDGRLWVMGLPLLGNGRTEADAWADAARRIREDDA